MQETGFGQYKAPVQSKREAAFLHSSTWVSDNCSAILDRQQVLTISAIIRQVLLTIRKE